MKKKFLFAAFMAITIFSACDKGDNNNDPTVKTIRYEFTTTNPANYSTQAIADTLVYTEFATGLTWTKTVTVTGSDSAFLTVFPPTEWINTSNEADVNLKIFVNNVEKASDNAHFIGLDRPNGLRIATAY